MRRPILLAACCLVLTGPVHAFPLQPSAPNTAPVFAAMAPKTFARCMRERYGPHFYRGVKRAHRYFMAQACGG